MFICSKINVLKHFIRLLFFVVIIIFLTSNCARKGRPDGGKKDSLAPLMVTANPPYKSIHFKSNKIKIYFDEYITLKEVTQQLVISPPLKYNPTITPQGTASKLITINITDTLKEQTTYTFNFGNSIQDNNEGNKLERFKYVFSTGNFIDSLQTKGTVKDAFLQEPKKNISILLYKIDSTFTDSIVYRKKPSYVTNTVDSTLFDLSNIKKGIYLLLALEDAYNDYLFNPKEDKIGVYPRHIKLPEDSILKTPIALYKEVPPFKLTRPKELNKGHLIFGFEGDPKGLKIETISNISEDYKNISKFETDKDTLNYWHFSNIKRDSLIFKVSAKNFVDTVTVFLRSKKIDSLKINPTISRILNLRDTLLFLSNNPITKIDTSKIKFITKKDSSRVSYTTKIDKKQNKIAFLFDKKHNTRYQLSLYPKALTDIVKTHNDSLNYLFSTKAPEDYGSIILDMQRNTTVPVIIELLTKKGKIVQRFYVDKNTLLNFNLLKPDNYIIRAIIDANGNHKWDTGNYLRKEKPEKVIYHPEVFKIKANWHFNEQFVIQ